MKTAHFQLESLSCPSCIIKIERTLEKTDGINEASVLFHSNKVKVEFNGEKVAENDLLEKMEELGYSVVA